jgi:myo-inositol-1(or 4)-monophosphatase
MSSDFETRRTFALRLADSAGAVVLPFFRKRVTVTNKGGEGLFDPVTEADRRAEAIIRASIANAFPDDAILGEELGDVKGEGPWRWVIDPVDGTRAFIAGQPMWGILIALEKDGVPVFGILDQPFLKERFVGVPGGAEMTGPGGSTPLKTRACPALSDAVIATTHPITHFGTEARERYYRVERACRLSRYGGDCYAYALLAMGFVDLVVEAELKRWDIAALQPIVEGAGGLVTGWDGGSIGDGGRVIAAGDARVHAEAVKMLAA